MTEVIITNGVGGVGIGTAADLLRQGRSALDAVEFGIHPVELDPAIRSVGRGGWPNLLGQVELDASLMDGRTLKTGAVGALQGYLHPISVARRLMEELPHVFLVGEGAARFAAEIGAAAGENLTEVARHEWRAWLKGHTPEAIWQAWPPPALAEWARLTADPETAGGTTTFLARDRQGDLAVGVSTCGWAFKYPGRLGDSPVIGAGNYADNRYGAAACTGMGELTIRAGTARAVVLYMKMGLSVVEACHEAAADLRALKREYRGGVTIHALNAEGEAYVLALSRGDNVPYWLWQTGMAEPEQHQAVIETWD